LVRQAQMVMKNAEETVRDENDRADVRIRFDRAYASLGPHGDDLKAE
jgi:uncharacterized membrane protein